MESPYKEPVRRHVSQSYTYNSRLDAGPILPNYAVRILLKSHYNDVMRAQYCLKSPEINLGF